MGKKQILLTLVSMFLLLILLNPSVEATPLPPESLPIDNVFAVPKGANSFVEGNITTVTSNRVNQIGSIFSTESNKLDLDKSFHAEMYVYLGDRWSGAADGMTFVMHNDQERTLNFTGGTGMQLGAYLGKNDLYSPTGKQIKNSFAIEFDTYHNGDGLDKGLPANSDRGHVAYSFPDKESSYTFSEAARVVSLNHQGIYYPNHYLSNNKWHLFVVDWNADEKVLSYKFNDAPTVDVPIDPLDVFGTNSVYWGFTGSTGAATQASKVVFKQIPGLVNVESTMKITKDGEAIPSTGIFGQDGDINVEYNLKYLGGKQDLYSSVFNLDLGENISYKPGTLKVNGLPLSDDHFSDSKLNYKVPEDLTTTNDNFTISFDATPAVITDKDTRAEINYSVKGTNYYGKDLKDSFLIKKSTIVTSADFDNQSWLINEINRQFQPKKIDKDIYETDLEEITTIQIDSGKTYPKEHIPATINKLTNLTDLHLVDLKLSGSLPTELGDLTNLAQIYITGNTFDGGIPSSIGNLKELTNLTIGGNTLKGTVPLSIAKLPKLRALNLFNNQLSGQLPDLPMEMDLIGISSNQVTYNSATLPAFMESAKLAGYEDTFLLGLKLSGNDKVSTKASKIKPFNDADEGYFNLKALQGSQTQDLYDDHTYTIKNTANGTVYYTGKKDVQATIPYEKGVSYTVILDGAEKNPNNVFTVIGKEEEFKFDKVPTSMSFKTRVGAKAQPVVLDGELSIFDNRENEHWKLNITPSILTQGQQELKGEYSYISKDGISHSITNGKKFLLESGGSDSINEVISISNSWNAEHGLNYTAYDSNYIGEYKGSVNWTLEDVP